MKLSVLLLFSLFASAALAADEDYAAMVELAWKRGCFNCHDVEQKVRGPAWRDVAVRYRDDETAFGRLIVTVRDGGRGNWGNDFMSPNRRVPEEDIKRLVAWLLTLESER
ncbi:c-type cytochrome [Azoarcus taiwanensis]|uniref:C-type cytochrome n=1 Tax=Azoarcus taiwanensis TaxID=666964 RepID=A0A972J883_9RHOO|nr:c-type cytochrome [Azoarcus taiwanensis]NMG03144.1 c-type cytochrome [Azoarcus taiwanensis]